MDWGLNRLCSSYSCIFSSFFFFREDVHSSPTKKYKRADPGSPEYESQPAVVITYVTGCFLQVANHIFLKCETWSQTRQAQAELWLVSGFLLLLAADLFYL
jgi:hypothetical protein